MPEHSARKNAERVSDAYAATRGLFEAHREDVRKVHRALLDELPRQLAATAAYRDEDVRHARELMDDPALVFRFLRRTQFHVDSARDALFKTLQWRAAGKIDSLAQDLLHSPFLSATRTGLPLFWMHSRFRDRLGRPALYMRLHSLERSLEGLHELKSTIIATLDVVRRYLLHVNRRTRRGPPVLQCVLVVDVGDAGISNIELELLPFLVDLLRNHYPGIAGAVYVLRFGWIQAGLWRMLRPVLPEKLLTRMFFVDVRELRAHFDHAVPRTLGGPLNVDIAPDTSDVFNYFVRAAAWRRRGHAPSDGEPPPALRLRAPDYESIYDVMSRVGSPYTSATPLTARSETPHVSTPATPLDTASAATARPSLMQWLYAWMMSSGMGPTNAAEPTLDTPSQPTQAPVAEDNASAPANKGPASDPVSAVTHYLSWRAHKYAKMDGHVSPYNIENPFFGYPATYVSDTDMSPARTAHTRPAGFTRNLHVLRRKRDLLRTLGYLLVLRLFSAYRALGRGVSVVIGALRMERAFAALHHFAALRIILPITLLLYVQALHMPQLRLNWRSCLRRGMP